MAEAGILYAAPNGSDSSACLLTEPCTIFRAQLLALNVSVPPLIRLLPGVFASGIDIATPSNAPVRVVATGATIASALPVEVQDGANVAIRGLAAIGSDKGVVCGSSTTSRSFLSLQDGVIGAGDGSVTLVTVGKCELTLSTTELDNGSSTGGAIGLSTDASLKADRIHIHGDTRSLITAFAAQRVFARITNSLLDNVGFIWTTNDSGQPGSTIMMGFNTIIGHSAGLNCQSNSGSAFRTSTYENNIVFSYDATTSVEGTDCTLSHNVLFPYPSPPGTNIAADPQFVDAAGKNYHLKATSPAVDAAVPTATFPAKPDFEGTLRPQGAQADIGAFELKP